ncbi:Hpt domain-containing protein [Undibacterium squillarum]|uniref:HPt domain-containing protein n=1 Tax=Undibacterium squillarum TaxID=1131567 RepID=A0ABQ2XTB5_9BURK|nr:Hpt domain-containing protein [Undibacterium squillarum]GGX31026.1 hypothetical protein GCM10010946_05140 [Undibacterium squillarum]
MTSVFDYTLALQHADQEIVQIMRAPFLAALPQYMQEIESALAELRHDDLRRHAHTLKGLAGNFSAEPVVLLCLQLEVLGQQKRAELGIASMPLLRKEVSALEAALSAT